MKLILFSSIYIKQIIGGAVPPQYFDWGGSCPPCPPCGYATASEGRSLFGRRDRYLGILMSVFSASAITIAQPNDAQTAHHDDQNMQINDRANI